ncbi:phasin family protein [Micromonospora sp. NPDC049366]|uniref:phasin family protein n=1 Tax=Micromonospora sp. NPDC049366 TaxID=3364271 RepID=UPI0037AEC67A
MQDAWRAYLELAMGLTEAPRKKAQDVVRRLAGSGGATAAQLQALGEELVSTGMANRDALTKLVRFEVDRALGAVGLATAEEVADLTRRVHELERQLREARAATPATGPGSGPAEPVPSGPEPTTTAGPMPTGGDVSAPVSQPPAKKAVAKKAVAKKAVAKKAVAKKAEPGKAVIRRSPAALTPTAGDAEPAHPAKKVVRKQQPGGAE